MEHHNTYIGKQGESVAATYLQSKGFQIVAQNFRYKRAEVDLIVRQDNLLVLVEVKTRSSEKFGYPEEAVSHRKQELLQMAAEEYIERINWQHDVRFDIISILWSSKGAEILHIEDAFH